MRRQFFSWVRGIPVLLLAPYLLTILFNGPYTALVNRAPDIELYLPVLVSQQISSEKELETVKAQAIIARTNFYRRFSDYQKLSDILSQVQESLHRTYGLALFFSDIYEEAVSQTEGQVLTWKGELKLVPYHEVSSGTTRDGEEVFHDKAYTYLKSVDSSVDKKSPDYLSSSYIAEQQMPKELVIKERDEAGYITSLLADGNLLEGEAFCQGMGLASSNFTIQKVGNQFRFLCKGKGHGLGFSQYGGNEMAKNGSTCAEILETYFPEMDLEEIFQKNE